MQNNDTVLILNTYSAFFKVILLKKNKSLQLCVSNDVVESTYKSRLKITENMKFYPNRTRFAIETGVFMTFGVLALLFTISDGFESLDFMAPRFSSRD